jgi:hypothetical protein
LLGKSIAAHQHPPSPFASCSKKVTDPMSTVPTPASIPEVLDMIDRVMSYAETPEFKALLIKTRLQYFDQVAAIARVLPVLRSGCRVRGQVMLEVSAL